MTDRISSFRECFQPRQWFMDDDGIDAGIEGDVLMWVYRTDEQGRWMVGYFLPDKSWFTESVYGTCDNSKERAAARVHWLNGGSNT